MNSIRLCLALLICLPSCCSSVHGQIELSYSLAKSLVGATAPEIVSGGRILMEADSKTSESIVAIVRVSSSERVRVRAMKSLKEFGELIPLTSSTVGTVTTQKYLLAGSGSFVIDAISASWDRTLDVEIGKQPDPIPPIPPPEPIPIPPPNIDVPNEYNVGLVSFKAAPKDPETAKKIATWYRVGASKLFGQGGLSDIATIRKQIETQFAQKTCKDQATCLQWDRWNKTVSDALVAEQVKRKTFTRQDFYTALVEVATSLEAVQ